VEDADGPRPQPPQRPAGGTFELEGPWNARCGSFADVVVFDPKAEWTYRAADSKSKSKNTPFDGWSMLAKSAGPSAKAA